MKNRQILRLLFLLTFFAVSFTYVSAKDNWIMVQSKNFKLIGNASESDIRKAASRLEQFREVFRQAFAGIKFVTSIPTNVIVFKSDSSYKPFKPKRADGKIDEFIAGFFQPGEDANYITLSTEGEDARTFEVIFHEYTHFLVNTNIGKSEVPPWFNEGLAEYYSTFAIEDDQKAKLGMFKQDHINLLASTKLLPLETLFGVTNYGLLQQGNHSRSIFYAESWALIHYFMQNGKSNELSNFLQLLVKGTSPEQAFQQSFQMTYAQMEKQLRNYVAQSSYKYVTLTFKNKLSFENEMQTLPISESAADAYLGDLLYHIRRPDDAEPFLQKAITLDANQSAAYTTLGMVRFRQGKFAEAKDYLEKAISDDQKNALALYYYAYALSRGEQDDTGFVSKFSPETAAKMRDALKRAIALDPLYPGNYDLLAFVGLVNNENLDEDILLLKKALAIQPGNQRFTLRIAEIYMRQQKLDDAKTIVEKIAKTADDPEIKSRAEGLLNSINQYQESRAQFEASKKQYEEEIKNNNNRPALTRRSNDDEKALSPEEEEMISLNQAVTKPHDGEKQIVGHITKIICAAGKITYTVKSGSEIVTLASKDFQNLTLVALVKDSENIQVGCGSNIANVNGVLTFKESDNPKSAIKGELLAIDFVPDNFKFVDTSQSRWISGTKENTKPQNTDETNKPNRQEAMFQAMKQALRLPKEGEKREQGLIEKMECGNKGITVSIKTDSRVMILSVNPAQSLPLRSFNQNFQQSQFGCGMKPLEYPVVFTYKPNADAKAKNDGELIALEFMPSGFKLED